MTKSQKTLAWVGAALAGAIGILLFTRKKAGADAPMPDSGPDPWGGLPAPETGGEPEPTSPHGSYPVIGKDQFPLHTIVTAERVHNGKLVTWFKGEGGVWIPNSNAYGEYASIGAIGRNHPVLHIYSPQQELWFQGGQWTPQAQKLFGVPRDLWVGGLA